MIKKSSKLMKKHEVRTKSSAEVFSFVWVIKAELVDIKETAVLPPKRKKPHCDMKPPSL